MLCILSEFVELQLQITVNIFLIRP